MANIDVRHMSEKPVNRNIEKIRSDMNRQGRIRQGCTVLVTALLGAGPALAQEAIKPYVFTSYSHDDNFFRVADDAEASVVTGSAKKDETVKRVGGGVKVALPLSRQTLFGDIVMERNWYERFSQLNNTGVKANAGLDWVVGSVFDGIVAYKYTTYLSTFEQLQAPTKDMHTEQQAVFSGGVNFLTDWRAVLELNRIEVTKEVQTELDRRTNRYAGELQFLTAANTYVGARYESAEFSYHHPLIVGGVRIPDDGKETTLSLVAKWEGSSKSQLTAEIGRTHFDAVQTINPDTTATTGRFVYDWIVSAKFRVNTALSREIETNDQRARSGQESTITDETAGYALTKGIELKPTWQVTSKVSASFVLRHKNLDYQDANVRSDTLNTRAAYLSYAPWRQLSLTASLTQENRDSSEANSAYRDQTYTLGAEYRFY